MSTEDRFDHHLHRQALAVPHLHPRPRAERQEGANPLLPLIDANEHPPGEMTHEVEHIAPRLAGEDEPLRGDEPEAEEEAPEAVAELFAREQILPELLHHRGDLSAPYRSTSLAAGGTTGSHRLGDEHPFANTAGGDRR